MASFIADGHHLDPATLRVLARAKGPANTILISDASPLAGLPAGIHGEWAVDPSGKIVVAGTPYLAGSNQGLEVGLQNLLQRIGLDARASHWHRHRRTPRDCSGDRRRDLTAGDRPTWSSFGRPRPEAFVLNGVCVAARWELRLSKAVARREEGQAVMVRPTPLSDSSRILSGSFAQAVAAGSLPSIQSPSSFW